MEGNGPSTPPPQTPPPMPRGPRIVPSAGLTVPTVPPQYANDFEIEPTEFDVTIRFRQRDPAFEAAIEQLDESVRAQFGTQRPSIAIAMSHQAAQALLAKLGSALR
jgi:hypothetical protein